jgi:hypothetical protein
MANAITARRDGDDFQARMFWMEAVRLLDPDSPVTRVGFEVGPSGFDDIWTEYAPGVGPQDCAGVPLRREHTQCKWHVSPNTFGYQELTDPKFINANARSFLQRARGAQAEHAPDGIGVRFRLLTNWRVDRSNPLREIISSKSGTLRQSWLFDGTTDRSAVGQLRRAWREHLNVSDADLEKLANTLAIAEATDSLDAVREHLDWRLGLVGLKRVPAHESAFVYDEIVYRWQGQGHRHFDRATLRELCANEGLLGVGNERSRLYGVKSFEHPIDRLTDRCTRVLDLVPQFDERHIRSEQDWTDNLYPRLRSFLRDAASESDRLRLVLDAHVTLAFAAGSILNIKSGRIVELEQRTIGRCVWAADDSASEPTWPALVTHVIDVDAARPDLAVAIGLTHSIEKQVVAYVAEALPSVGRVVVCEPQSGPGARSVLNGRHAFELCEQACAAMRAHRTAGRAHLFLAGPNAFAFFLGQRQPAIGRVCLYEFDFEGTRTGSYRQSLCLPIAEAAAACTDVPGKDT